jgi:hypothetical protein
LLHPPVLEPDLDLSLVELQGGRDLDPPRPRQVFVEVELFLQLGQLFGGKIGPARVVGTAESSQTADASVATVTSVVTTSAWTPNSSTASEAS